MTKAKTKVSRLVSLEDVVVRTSKRCEPEISSVMRWVAADHVDEGDSQVRRWSTTDDPMFPPTFRFRVPAGSVLVHSRNPNKVATLDFDAITGEKFFCLTSRDESRLLSSYVALQLQSDHFEEYSTRWLSGSVNKFLNWSALARYEFELPSLDEQARVVELLSAIDDHIDSLQRQDEVLRSLRYTTIDDFMTNPRPSWPHLTINQCVSINPTGIKLDADSPFVPMENVIAGVRFVLEFESRGSRSGCRARGGDVLFARITPCLENGKTAQVPYEIEVCGGSTEFIVLSPSQLVTADFIYVWATWPRLRSIAASMMTGTTGRQRLSPQALGGIEIDLPSVQEQKELVAKIEAIDSLIVHNQLSSVSAKNLRMSLLNSEVK